MITVIPRKIAATLINGISPNNDGSITISAENITNGVFNYARIPIMQQATAAQAGISGAVPAPSAGDQAKYLRGDGTWDTITSETVGAGNTTTNVYQLAASGNKAIVTMKGHGCSLGIVRYANRSAILLFDSYSNRAYVIGQLIDTVVIQKNENSKEITIQNNSSTAITLIATGATIAAGTDTTTITENVTRVNFAPQIPVSIVNGGTGATTSADALTNLGAVAKAGDTMTGDLTIKSSHVSFTDSNNQEMAFIVGRAESGKKGQFTIQEKVYGTSYYENYNFPIPDSTLIQNYDVLTTKALVSVPQGGTGAATPEAARTNLGIIPENIGAVAKAGDTMTGVLTIPSTTGSHGAGLTLKGGTYPKIAFTNSSDNYYAEIVATHSNGNGQFYVIEYNTANSSNRERYYFPEVSNTSGNTQDYNILTNKPGTIGSLSLTGSIKVNNNLYIYNSSLPTILFQNAEDSTTYGALIRYRFSDNVFYIETRQAGKSSGPTYKLPIPDSTTGSYDILTSKTPVAIDQGGTGSTTKNFVDLTTNQTVAGIKTFTSRPLIDISATQLAADTTANILSFNYQNSNQKTKTVNVIRTYGDSENGTANGIALIGSNSGTTVVTAGDAAPTIIKNEGISNTENIYLISDGSIQFYVNGNTAANAFKALNITTGGYFVINSPSSGEFAGAIFSNIGSVNKYLTAYDIANKTWLTRVYNDAGTASAEYRLPSATTVPSGGGVYNILTTKSAVTVAQGGTGATSFTANCAIISGSTTTGALTTRAITNNTATGHANWTSSTGTNLITLNTLAYFNGRYSSSASNLAYCNKGAFGDIVTHAASEFTTEVDFTSSVTNSASGAANVVSKFRKIGNVCMVTYQCTCTFSDTQWTLFTINNASYRPKAAFYTTGFCSSGTTVSGQPYAVVFQVNTDGTVKRIASQYTGSNHLVWCNFCYSVA